MAWSYADFESQATDALRLTRLRLHIAELGAAIDANVAKGGVSRASDPLNTRLDQLNTRRVELERRTQQSAVRVRFDRRS